MKKKLLIIVVIIIICLFIIGVVTSYLDSARVRNNMEPKYTIKIVSEDGRKVTYLGLGYKVIRYTGVSPNEPFKNNIGAKYGNWFMNYELEEEKELKSEIITKVAYANWASNYGGLCSDEKCISSSKMILSDVPRFPLLKFETKSELEEFKNKYKDVFTMNQGYDEVSSFNDVTSEYNDEFFEKHILMIAYVEANSGSFRYTISEVKKKNGNLIFKVLKTNNPEVYTSNMCGWFLIAELEKEYIKDCIEFDAELEK